jgi:hydrogenase small subunit
MTTATQPGMEDIIFGAYENGDEFLRRFRRAAAGEVDPFILVIEGSIPDENNKSEGYCASFGTDSAPSQPITTCEWDRQVGAEGLGCRGGRIRPAARDSRII